MTNGLGEGLRDAVNWASLDGVKNLAFGIRPLPNHASAAIDGLDGKGVAGEERAL